MALPKLEVPKYTLTIPSSGDVIEYRPFLVKEEKNLMIAQETGEDSAQVDAMIGIIEACTFNKLDINKLTTYDVEYIFLQIRAKSVGETADITLPCEKSGKRKQVTINLTEAYVANIDSFESEKVVKITDDVGLTLRPFTLSHLRTIGDNSDITRTVKLLIHSIYDADGVYLADESSDAELTEFIESLPHKALEEISTYMESIPTLVLDVEFIGSTGHKNKVQLKGLNSFFV